jgi:hypothetical protein
MPRAGSTVTFNDEPVGGYEVAETTDESLERVAAIRRMSAAYLRTALHIDENSWADARAALSDGRDPICEIKSKRRATHTSAPLPAIGTGTGTR